MAKSTNRQTLCHASREEPIVKPARPHLDHLVKGDAGRKGHEAVERREGPPVGLRRREPGDEEGRGYVRQVERVGACADECEDATCTACAAARSSTVDALMAAAYFKGSATSLPVRADS
jgi:hypothetical protein